MSRSMSFTGPDRSAPRWSGESIGERLVLAKLDPAAFPQGAVGTLETAAGRVVVSGTLVGRTYAEREAGTGYGPFTAGDDDYGLIAWDAEVGATKSNDAELVPDTVFVKENYLPDWETLAAAAKTAIRQKYVTMQAVR